mgnify:FL=1
MELFIIAVLLFFDLVLLIQLGFAISNLRNEVAHQANELQTRIDLVQARITRDFEGDLNHHHNMVMNTIADMYKDIVRNGGSEGKDVVGQASENNPANH